MKGCRAAAVLLLAWPALAAGGEGVTFNKHVAPILWKHCAGCHRPGEVGPFSLLTYRDAARRAEFIRDITASKRMPPWKAEAGFGQFTGERRLSAQELQVLADWANAGAPEGKAADLPAAPRFREGWQLGKPDLILEMPDAFAVPAGGADVWRCFVIPIPLAEDRTVAAIEFRPGNRRVVHHASFHLDAEGQARKKDRADGKPGYASFGDAGIKTSGTLGGWTLGSMPRFLPEGTGILLKKGNDLVLQMHYHPSGKDENDRSALAVYFTRKPVSRYVTRFFVSNNQLDIPAGARRHAALARSDPLPFDVEVLAISAHAHNLAREIKATATREGGEPTPLVWIKDWDFNWHEVYRFEKPVKLSRGTVVKLEAFFDNTRDNPKNPNNPPKRVVWGTNVTDEMLGCEIHVVVNSPAELDQIRKLRGPDMKSRVLRLGGVAYGPSAVSVWRGIRTYFARNNLPCEFTLYSTYDDLIKALRDGQVDIAWNSPLAHARYHLLAGGQSQTLVMRDVDCGCRCKLLVRKDAGISTLADLKDKTIVMGSRDSAENVVLPTYFLKKEGVFFDQLKTISLHEEVDEKGTPCSSEHHVLAALMKGRGQAGIVSELLWRKLQAEKGPEVEALQEIWTSPPFSHCVFTARKDFDKDLGARFTRLMLAMDGKDAVTEEVLRLEHCSRWVVGTPDGFEVLLNALRDEEARPRK
jgi:ABC-type phosphate/phosphonate transport system substrate-binding protein